MRYLTVQDLLWINTQATKTVNGFEYAELEEATYYQYAYGTSKSLTAQASRFLTGFVAKSPFVHGNRATAFIAFAAFVRLNHGHLNISDSGASDWLDHALTDASVIDASILIVEDHGHELVARTVIGAIMAEYANTVTMLDRPASVA